MDSEFVELKIDVDRMAHGKEVALRLRGTEKGGIPWIVILDADGKKLVDADGPDGNIGCPVSPEERAHFMDMIARTAQRLTEAQIATLKAELDSFGEAILAKRKG